MSNYLEKVKDKEFISLKDDSDFQDDLIRFFTGDRYNYSREELLEKGAEGLTEDFITHMRYQATNEVTALKDLQYVQDRENVSDQELESFGNLMNAFDHSGEAGTGVLDGAKDFIGAIASSPSTAATLATGGWGVGSKLAARGATKAAQLAIRSQIDDLIKKGLGKKAVKEAVQKSVLKEGLKGAGRSAAFEGAIGTAIGYSRGETREEVIEGYEYDTTDLALDAALSATVGSVIGGGTAAFGQRAKNKAADALSNVAFKEKSAKTRAKNAAEKTIKQKRRSPNLKKATDQSIELFKNLAVREQTELLQKTKPKLNPLDADLVKRGQTLRSQLLQTGVEDTEVTPGLSLDTLKGITAATMDLIDKVKPSKGERITSAVARFMSTNKNIKEIEKIKKKYGLSSEDFSLIYLADLSEAGKKLNEASQISKKLKSATPKTKAQQQIDEILLNIKKLNDSRLTTFNDNFAQSIISNAIKNKGGKVGTVLNLAKELDSARIAFMTSQVGTTAANAFTSGFNTFLDISDQFWKGLLTGEAVQRGWTKGVFANLRGMTLSKDEALILREMMLKEQPIAYRNLFHDVQRAEITIESNSILSQAGRFVNTLNSGVDAIFKQSMLYAGVDRRLRQQGRTFAEFIESGQTIEKGLPPGLLQDAIEDAQRFTFQQTYAGDKSSYGRLVKGVVKAHREAPFIISGALGIPFPRYIANHLEYINDYTPIGLVTGGLSGLESQLYKGTKYKTWQDRTARQISGAAMLMGGVYLAAQKQGELDYGSLETISGGTVETGRVAGPFAAHLLLGDLIYRYFNGLPIKNMGEDSLEVALGMGDLGFDFSLVKDVQDSIKTGEFTVGFEKRAGNIVSTFTYPATIARDIKAQLDMEAAGSPFTRPLIPGDEGKVSDFGERNFLMDILQSEYIAAQSARFLPDLDFIQYADSFNGKNDIKIYGGFNERATGSINPLTKQIGFREDPPLNKLQKEMNILKIEEYELVNSRTIKNPTVYHAVTLRLSKTMPQLFEAWSEQVVLGTGEAGEGKGAIVYGNRTYDELDKDYKLKEVALRKFVQEAIANEVAIVEKAFEDLLTKAPKAAVGFIRNQYAFTEQEMIDKTKMKNIYDYAAQQLAKEDGSFYANAGEYITDTKDVAVEVIRRQEIMSIARAIADGSSKKVVSEIRRKNP